MGYVLLEIQNHDGERIRWLRFYMNDIAEFANLSAEMRASMLATVTRLGVTLDQEPDDKSALETLVEVEEAPLWDYICARLGVPSTNPDH